MWESEMQIFFWQALLRSVIVFIKRVSNIEKKNEEVELGKNNNFQSEVKNRLHSLLFSVSSYVSRIKIMFGSITHLCSLRSSSSVDKLFTKFRCSFLSCWNWVKISSCALFWLLSLFAIINYLFLASMIAIRLLIPNCLYA